MRILICDDQAIVRDGLEMLLKLEKDMQIAGKAEDGAHAVELTAQCKPDVVLMDLKMPVMNGVEATREIRARFPDTKILVLTTYDDDEWLMDALRAGASGYLLKDTPRDRVVQAVRGTALGKTFLDPAIAGKVVQQITQPSPRSASTITAKLTERELDVLKLIARGMNNADIAQTLHLSEGTVRNYVSVILDKLDLTDRTQAAVLALQHGLGSD